MTSSPQVGWQHQPDGRGTFDILKTCIGTILLLCWSSVCPNLPKAAKSHRRLSNLEGKLHLFLLAVIGPDFIFMVALGQLNAAWRVKKQFLAQGYPQWGLRHCFFVNMGGIHIRFPDRVEAGLHTFPVDGEQLLFLVEKGHVKMPDLDDDEIEERNKTDELGRVIAIIQSLWFTSNTFGRIAQGLFITTLELTTLAFVFLMSACAICWWRKPMDIMRPIIITADASLHTVLSEAGADVHGRTPLSFYNRGEWFMSQIWTFFIQILRNLRLVPRKTSGPAEGDHFPSIEFPETDAKWELAGGPLIVLYSAIFMAAWRFDFPTDIERTLWRVSSITCLVYGAVGCALAWVWHNATASRHGMDRILPSRMRKESPRETNNEQSTNTASKSKHRSLSAWLTDVSRHFDRTRNLSPHNDPALAVPIRLWFPTTLLCVAYVFTRAYILVEDVVALRSLPESAYQTVDWGQYAPIF